ncbi:MAG: hypothetical protein ACLQLH_09455 [Terracidiphilus sp.]
MSSSFDQRGVGLGMVLAQRMIPELGTEERSPPRHDSSTNTLIRHGWNSRRCDYDHVPFGRACALRRDGRSRP